MNKRQVQYVTIPDRRRATSDRRKDNQIEPETAPPCYSLEAEQSLIGGLLIDNTALPHVLRIANESHIYPDDLRRIFIHILRIIERGDEADIVTVFASIEASNEAGQTGGMSYLGEISNNTPSAANILSYARIVREKYILRQLAEAGKRIEALATCGGSAKLIDRLKEARKCLDEPINDFRDYSKSLP